MTRSLAIGVGELKIAFRNLWVVTASGIMLLFALALTFAGSAPTGALGVDLLTVSIASMTTLSVYLTPLLALMMAFDALAGERERGSLALLLTTPMSRGELLIGKFLAHLSTLALAFLVGFGVTGAVTVALDSASLQSLPELLRLYGTSLLLGAVFLGLGYALSAMVQTSAAAAGLSAALWLVLVVLYDLGLLGALVVDGGEGVFARVVFPWLLTVNPADAFRLWNVAASDNLALATGMSGAAEALPIWAAPLSLLLWPLAALLLARLALGRMEP